MRRDLVRRDADPYLEMNPGGRRHPAKLVAQRAVLVVPDDDETWANARRDQRNGTDEEIETLVILDRSDGQEVRAEPGRAPDVAAALRETLPNAAVFDAATFLANNRAEIEAGFLPVLWTIALLALLVGGIVVALTAHTAVLEKRADFALLAALGATRGARLGVVLQHALTAAAVGGVAALGLLFALQAALPAVVPEIELLIGARIAGAAVAGAAVMAALGAALPARLAMRVPPMEAFRR